MADPASPTIAASKNPTPMGLASAFLHRFFAADAIFNLFTFHRQRLPRDGSSYKVGFRQLRAVTLPRPRCSGLTAHIDERNPARCVSALLKARAVGDDDHFLPLLQRVGLP